MKARKTEKLTRSLFSTFARCNREGNLDHLFIFEKSIVEGKKGEDLFFELYSRNPFLGEIRRSDGIKEDFFLGDKSLELKSEYYDALKTPNFFIEKFSNFEAMTFGGPWRAEIHDVFYYAHFFTLSCELYLFKTKELMQQIRGYDDRWLLPIRNKTWTTYGFKVLRTKLRDVYDYHQL